MKYHHKEEKTKTRMSDAFPVQMLLILFKKKNLAAF